MPGLPSHSAAPWRAALATLAPVLTLLSGACAWATESAGTNAALGATSFGTPVFPDPGLYGSWYTAIYSTSRLNGADARQASPNATGSYQVQYGYLTYVAPFSVGDWRFGAGAVVSHGRASADVADLGASQKVSGWGDTLVQPLIVGRRIGDFHMALAQGFIAPTGHYQAGDLVSIGRNVWSSSSQLSLGWIPPKGVEATATLTYIRSGTNRKAKTSPQNPLGKPYRSGDEFAVDFALGYNFTTAFELGLAGYFYRQISDDRIADPDSNADLRANFGGYRGAALAIGPAVRYLSPMGELFLQIQREVRTTNRTQGNAVWARWNFKF